MFLRFSETVQNNWGWHQEKTFTKVLFRIHSNLGEKLKNLNTESHDLGSNLYFPPTSIKEKNFSLV